MEREKGQHILLKRRKILKKNIIKLYLEEVPEGVVGELGEAGVAGDGGPWVNFQLLADDKNNVGFTNM